MEFILLYFQSPTPHEYWPEPFFIFVMSSDVTSGSHSGNLVCLKRKHSTSTDVLLMIHLIAQVSGDVTQYILSHICVKLLT